MLNFKIINIAYFYLWFLQCNLEATFKKIKVYDNGICCWEATKVQPHNMGSILKLIIKTNLADDAARIANKLARKLNSDVNSHLFQKSSIRIKNDKNIYVLLQCHPQISIWPRSINKNKIVLHPVKNEQLAHFCRTMIV